MNIETIPVGTTLTPKVINGEILTGFAIVHGTFETHPTTLACMVRWESPTKEIAELYKTSYNVLTDFGNTLRLTYIELMQRYELGKVDNVQERLTRQLELLQEVKEELSEQ